MSRFGVRYRAGTELARRFGTSDALRFDSEEEAEKIRAACINAEHMETFSA